MKQRGARRPPAATAPAPRIRASALPRPRPSGAPPGRGAPQSPRGGPARPAHGPLSGLPTRIGVARAVPHGKTPSCAASRPPPLQTACGNPCAWPSTCRHVGNMSCLHTGRARPKPLGFGVRPCYGVRRGNAHRIFPRLHGKRRPATPEALHRAKTARPAARMQQRSGDDKSRTSRRTGFDPAQVLQDAAVQLRLTRILKRFGNCEIPWTVEKSPSPS